MKFNTTSEYSQVTFFYFSRDIGESRLNFKSAYFKFLPSSATLKMKADTFSQRSHTQPGSKLLLVFALISSFKLCLVKSHSVVYLPTSICLDNVCSIVQLHLRVTIYVLPFTMRYFLRCTHLLWL